MRGRVFVLTGPVRSGKTTLLRKAVAALKKNGKRVGGYLSLARRVRGRAEGYDLVPVGEGGRCAFLDRGTIRAAGRVGPFHIDPRGLRLARALIRTAPVSRILIVDEVGPLELAGGGVRRALEEALSVRTRPTLLVVRESILVEMLGALRVDSARVIDVRTHRAFSVLKKWLNEMIDS